MMDATSQLAALALESKRRWEETLHPEDGERWRHHRCELARAFALDGRIEEDGKRASEDADLEGEEDDEPEPV